MSDAGGLKSSLLLPYLLSQAVGVGQGLPKKQYHNGSTLPQPWADSQVYYCCGCRAAPAISGHALGVSKECRRDTTGSV